jgi:hypothetical protein
LTAEASLISFVCVVAVFIRIAVRPILFRVFVLIYKINFKGAALLLSEKEGHKALYPFSAREKTRGRAPHDEMA